MAISECLRCVSYSRKAWSMVRKLIKVRSHHSRAMHVERFVSDVWGPARVVSIGGCTYYILFIADTKRFNSIVFLAKKSEATGQIKCHVARIKMKFGKGPTFMPIDNGKELINAEIRKFAAEKGITIKTMIGD